MISNITVEKKKSILCNSSCVGEAAAFADPLYSTGSDLIAWANSSVTTLIELDKKQMLHEEIVQLYDNSFKDLVDFVSSWTINMYLVFGDDLIMLRKLLWDALAYFLSPVRMLLHEFLQSPESLKRYNQEMKRCYLLNQKMQALFLGWSKNISSKNADSGLYVAEAACEYFNDLACLQSKNIFSGFNFLNKLSKFIDKMEVLANVFTTRAKEDGLTSSFNLPEEKVLEQLEKYMRCALA